MSPSRHSTAGFTLIELLVVISVIAILAAMLLPAVGMIRDLANGQKCGTNLRQLQLANLSYANENEGLLAPGIVYDIPGAGNVSWARWYPLLENIDAQWDAPGFPMITNNGVPQSVWCPAVPRDSGFQYPQDYGTGGVYGYNMTQGGTLTQWSTLVVGLPNWNYGCVVLDKLPNKASRIAFCDGNGPWVNYGDPLNWSGGYDPVAVNQWGSVLYRHRDKAMASWMDGHVQPFTAAQIQDDPAHLCEF